MNADEFVITSIPPLDNSYVRYVLFKGSKLDFNNNNANFIGNSNYFGNIFYYLQDRITTDNVIVYCLINNTPRYEPYREQFKKYQYVIKFCFNIKKLESVQFKDEISKIISNYEIST